MKMNVRMPAVYTLLSDGTPVDREIQNKKWFYNRWCRTEEVAECFNRNFPGISWSGFELLQRFWCIPSMNGKEPDKIITLLQHGNEFCEYELTEEGFPMEYPRARLWVPADAYVETLISKISHTRARRVIRAERGVYYATEQGMILE